MSVPVKHHSKGKVGRRRSHHALKPTNILACTSCKAPVLAHRVCGFCGAMQTRKVRAAAVTPPAEAVVQEEASIEEAVAASNKEETPVEAPAKEADDEAEPDSDSQG